MSRSLPGRGAQGGLRAGEDDALKIPCTPCTQRPADRTHLRKKKFFLRAADIRGPGCVHGVHACADRRVSKAQSKSLETRLTAAGTRRLRAPAAPPCLRRARLRRRRTTALRLPSRR